MRKWSMELYEGRLFEDVLCTRLPALPDVRRKDVRISRTRVLVCARRSQSSSSSSFSDGDFTAVSAVGR